MLLDRLTRTEQNARRLAEIVGVLAKYGLADWMGGIRQTAWFRRHLTPTSFQKIANVSHEARIRLALTELGTTFIKVGQVLGTRPDIVSPNLADELSKLQTDTPPDPPEVVRQTIADELGRPPEELFAEFETTPIASASIGQVHGGILHDGRRIVVKVMRKGIQDKVARDLDLLAGLAELAERYYEPSRAYRPTSTVRQFRKSINRELDFTAERKSLERFARNFTSESGVKFPAPVAELSSRRVLTMERLDGIHGLRLREVAAPEASPGDIAMRAARIYLQMIFQDGFYHADPHPGNYLVLDGGVLGLLDAGMVGRLDEELRDRLESLIVAVYHRDAGRLTDSVMALGETQPTDPAGLRSEVNEFVHDFADVPLNEFDLTAALNRITDIIRRFGILLPPDVAMLLRTLVVLEGSARQLSPTFSLAEVINLYVHEHGTGQLWRRLRRKMQRTARDWDRFLGDLPRELDEIMKRFREGKLDIHHEHKGIERTVNRLVRGIICAALIMGSTMLWSRETPPLLYGISVFGTLGYAMAMWMAFWLIRSTRE
ncbi:MAG TPA: AarF/ABC1/UbiB kinase family protein [Gemmataceae bacterium]|jgi:ubiquinone biosynthesis protein|nr:AarF/ABC1/UbiB kinase family protein [Gemmataceae bacterium]